MTFYYFISFLLGLVPLGCILVLRPWMPRSRWMGLCLGIPVLLCCAFYGAGMLPEGGWRTLCYMLVPVVTLLSCFLMDFIFARAFGGFLVLSANYLISHAFGYDCFLRPLYCLIVLAFGIWGMVLIAWPWHLRNVCEWIDAGGRKYRRRLLAGTAAIAFLLMFLPLI